MPIVTQKLIAAPMLQDPFVAKDGTPLAGGIITLYQDASRTTLKNWYEQVDVGNSSYIYIPLPNPMILSAAGTIQDGSGQDVIPYFYPYSEIDNTTVQTYYIVVTDSNHVVQFTRENFPFNVMSGGGTTTGSTLENYIVNGVFWRNIGTTGTISANLTPLAPSAHDGYSTGFNSGASSNTSTGGGADIQYFTNITGDTDVVTFDTIPAGTFLDPNNIADATPEYYMNVTCSAVSMTPATKKWVQFPIQLHVKNLESQLFSVTFYAQTGGVAESVLIYPQIFQFLGTGAAAQPAPILIGSAIPLTGNWVKYVLSATFPPAPVSADLSKAGDDALYLTFGFDVSKTFNINISKPELYLGNTIPSNSWQAYSFIEPICSDFRTGDTRASLNAFQPGWVLCNDGLLGPSGGVAGGSGVPIARAANDTWPLYNLLWGLISTNSLPNAFYTSTGSSSSAGSTAYADWSAGKQIVLSKQLGNAIASAGLSAQSGGITTWTVGQVGGHETHTLGLEEIPNHTHNAYGTPAGGNFIYGVSTGGTNANVGAGTTAFEALTTGNISTYTSQTALSLVQGTTFYNVLLKL